MLKESYEKKFTIKEEDTALALGSGGEKVLATPRLVAWMENLAFEISERMMEEGKTTVGTLISVKHSAASPIGVEVLLKATLVSQEKRIFNFEIQAWDAIEKIGEATHQRVIVDKKKFTEKAFSKKQRDNHDLSH